MNLVNGLVALLSVPLYHYRPFSLSRNKKNKLETVPLKNPNKKNKINNLSRSQVFVAHSLWVICRNVSRSFVELCMETPYWCTNMANMVLVHQYGRRKRKHLEFTFSRKALSFHSRTRIRAHKHIF